MKDIRYTKSTSGAICNSIVKVSHWDDSAGSEGSVGWWGYLVDD